MERRDLLARGAARLPARVQHAALDGRVRAEPVLVPGLSEQQSRSGLRADGALRSRGLQGVSARVSARADIVGSRDGPRVSGSAVRAADRAVGDSKARSAESLREVREVATGDGDLDDAGPGLLPATGLPGARHRRGCWGTERGGGRGCRGRAEQTGHVPAVRLLLLRPLRPQFPPRLTVSSARTSALNIIIFIQFDRIQIIK